MYLYVCGADFIHTCAPPISWAGVGTKGVKVARSVCVALQGTASRPPPCPCPAQGPCPGQGLGENAGPPLAAVPSCSWSPAAFSCRPRCLCLCHCPDGGAEDSQWDWVRWTIPTTWKKQTHHNTITCSQKYFFNVIRAPYNLTSWVCHLFILSFTPIYFSGYFLVAAGLKLVESALML